MKIFGFKINDNYATELSILNNIRDFKDGITFFDLNVNFDYFKGDHNPKFSAMFIFLNLVIFEFNIYNLNHINDIDAI